MDLIEPCKYYRIGDWVLADSRSSKNVIGQIHQFRQNKDGEDICCLHRVYTRDQIKVTKSCLERIHHDLFGQCKYTAEEEAVILKHQVFYSSTEVSFAVSALKQKVTVINLVIGIDSLDHYLTRPDSHDYFYLSTYNPNTRRAWTFRERRGIRIGPEYQADVVNSLVTEARLGETETPIMQNDIVAKESAELDDKLLKSLLDKHGKNFHTIAQKTEFKSVKRLIHSYYTEYKKSKTYLDYKKTKMLNRPKDVVGLLIRTEEGHLETKQRATSSQITNEGEKSVQQTTQSSASDRPSSKQSSLATSMIRFWSASIRREADNFVQAVESSSRTVPNNEKEQQDPPVTVNPIEPSTCLKPVISISFKHNGSNSTMRFPTSRSNIWNLQLFTEIFDEENGKESSLGTLLTKREDDLVQAYESSTPCSKLRESSRTVLNNEKEQQDPPVTINLDEPFSYSDLEISVEHDGLKRTLVISPLSIFRLIWLQALIEKFNK